jgi:hypothetical protein
MARVTRKFNDTVGVEWCEFALSAVKDLLRSPGASVILCCVKSSDTESAAAVM